MDKHNREVKRAVNNYNAEARSYNSQVRTNRQRLRRELTKLARQPATSHVTYRFSVQSLHEAYARVEAEVEGGAMGAQGPWILDLTEREASNSVAAMNALLESPSTGKSEGLADLQETTLANELRVISPELDRRWHGALFALDPRNPDAARHFCASSREILARIINHEAPDKTVLEAAPECARTPEGKPIRRAKIEYILGRKAIRNTAVASFIENDLDNVVSLFSVFNEGTHGPAGQFDLPQLSALKRRVEDAVRYLHALSR